jgi:hypothetical protein
LYIFCHYASLFPFCGGLLFGAGVCANELTRPANGLVGIGQTPVTHTLEVGGVVIGVVFAQITTQKVMSNSDADFDISSVIGTIPNVEGSITFEMTMRERSTTTNQLFRLFYIRVGPGTTFATTSAIVTFGSTFATTTFTYPSAGIIRFNNSSFSVLDVVLRRISL